MPLLTAVFLPKQSAANAAGPRPAARLVCLCGNAPAQTEHASPTSQPPGAEAVAGVAVLQRALPAVVTLRMLDRTGTERGQGTGFFIRPDGLLVTARHVAEGGRDLLAVTSGGRTLPVTGFVGDDRDFDVAVLQVDGTNLPHLTLADTVRSHEWVGVVTPDLRAGRVYLAKHRIGRLLKQGVTARQQCRP